MPQTIPFELVADVVSVSTPIAAVVLFVWQLIRSLFRDRGEDETLWSWLRDIMRVTVSRVGVFVVLLGLVLIFSYCVALLVGVWGLSGFGIYVVLLWVGACLIKRVSELIADLRNGAARNGG